MPDRPQPPSGRRGPATRAAVTIAAATFVLVACVAVGFAQPAPRRAAAAARTAAPRGAALRAARARRAVDRVQLARAFALRRYRPPAGARLLITRVLGRSGALRYQRFSYRDTGLTSGGFWPASTVKLWTAVGALVTARAHKLDSRARVLMRDSYGVFRGSLARLVRPSIVWSSNRAYDRLVMLTGADRLNTVLAPRFGLGSLVIQCPYFGGASLASPPLRLGAVAIAARPIRARFAACSYPANCASLFDLQEVLRRVVLHHELALAERFPLAPRDVSVLRRALRRARDKISLAARRALRTRAFVVYNKAGRYPGRDHLENALVVTRDGRRYLVTVSVAYSRRARSDRATARQLERLAYEGLRAIEMLRHPRAAKKIPVRL